MSSYIASENHEMKRFMKEVGLHLPSIPTERNYWLLRTEGGDLYEEFINGGFVAIGWNELSDKKYTESVNRTEAEQVLVENYSDHKQPGLVLNNIIRFYKELKKGDVVLIPSASSKTIGFGIIESEVYIEHPSQTELDEGACEYIKRRAVNWVKYIPKHKLDLKLFKMLQSRHTISNANDYAKEIDSSLHNFYIKGDHVHYTISINRDKNLSALSLKTLANIPWIAKEYINSDYILDELETTIYVKSPGKQELIAKGKDGLKYLFGVSVIVILLTGGKVEGLGITIEANGVLDSLVEWDKLNKQHEEEMMKLKNEALIESPSPEIKQLENEDEDKETSTDS